MNLAHQRITVMGLGRFGGGSGVAQWLAKQGARVLITDLQSAEQLAEPIESLRDLIDADRIALRLGEHDETDFTNADLVIANPAVQKPWENRCLNAAQRAGVPITTEIRLLLEHLDRRQVIGVTGTAGKSTTAAMIHHVLTNAGGRSHLGGNIGGSLLHALDSVHPDDQIVLELSSFMLHWLGEGIGNETAHGISPHIAVLTNIEPNHLDWHGTFKHYEACKGNIFRYQQKGDHAIDGRAMPAPAHDIPLIIPGRHNQRNAQLALSATAHVLDAEPNDLAQLLSDFPGLPHRLQLVAENDGTRCFNDSKSTTPSATMLAVEAFDDPSHVHLIAGGYDKGSDITPIASLAPHLAGLYTIGSTGGALAEAANSDRAMHCETLDRAVEAALDRLRPGDVLLLSPGCASWDQFTSYEQRGERFGQLLEAHWNRPAAGKERREAARGGTMPG